MIWGDFTENTIILKDVCYGDHDRHKYDIYIPQNPESVSGAILYIHGGGWHSGDKSDHRYDCEYFSNLGYISASMNYRFVSEELSVSDELEDINSALKSIKLKCSEFGFDLNKAVLAGGSAGAHLSLMYAYTKISEAPVKPVAVCAYCPPVDCSESDFLMGISGEFESWKYGIMSKCAGCKIEKETLYNEEQQAALKSISPINYVSKNCVPTAVFHGRKDDLIPVRHIEMFLSKLKSAGVKNDYLQFVNSGHNLNADPDTHDTARKIISEYLSLYL